MPKKTRATLSRPPCRQQVTHAIGQLLEALGVAAVGPLAETPARAASLWIDYLLAGQQADVRHILRQAVASASRAPVSVQNIGVHLVCPHHLTVAFGKAHLAYTPAGRLAGFSTLANLVQACTARLVLQEEASQHMADALVTHLQASAAVACIEAVHPCHTVVHPPSHAARVISWARSGQARQARELQQLMRGKDVLRGPSACVPMDF